MSDNLEKQNSTGDLVFIKCNKCGVMSARYTMEYVSPFPYHKCICVCKECADRYAERKFPPAKMLERK